MRNLGPGNPLTRRPSDGSVPAMAPALAAVRDSTSSSGARKSPHTCCECTTEVTDQ